MNTPATPLYDKSRHIFGLHHAKETIRRSGYVLLAEGNLDVIASWQAGTRQCVATAGTALTEHQLKALCRFTPDVRLCFDADRAGVEATERALPIASKVGVNLGIVTIPDGKDPDELIRKDATVWEKITQQPQYAMDWLVERYRGQLDLTTAQGKRTFSDTIMQMVRQLDDTVEQEHYIGVVADLTDSTAEAVRAKLVESQTNQKRLKRAKTAEEESADESWHKEVRRVQDRMLALVLLQPQLREAAGRIDPAYFVDDDAKELLVFVQQNPDFNGDVQQAEALRPLANRVKITSLQYEELYQGLDLNELRLESARLEALLVELYVKHEKQSLRRELDAAQPQAIRTLLERGKELDTLLGKYKRA